MGLRAKFNLAVFAAFLVGFALAGFLLQRLFVENARDAVVQNARIMMQAADAIRRFTDTQVAPLAAAQNSVKFNPASVPSFVAQTTFKELNHGGYARDQDPRRACG